MKPVNLKRSALSWNERPNYFIRQWCLDRVWPYTDRLITPELRQLAVNKLGTFEINAVSRAIEEQANRR